MALKALLLKKQIDNKRKALNGLLETRKAHEEREAELTRAIEEVETEEQRAEVEGMVSEFESERDANEQAITDLENEIEGLENDLAAEEAAQNTEPPAGAANAQAQTSAESEERSYNPMNTSERIPQMTLRDRVAGIVTRDDVRDYLGEVRAAIKEKRAINNASLTIPDVMLSLMRKETAKNSRLLPFVYMQHVAGKGRQNIMGAIPEAVWTEMCAELNELNLGIYQVEVDGYEVGGWVPICNALLEDSDMNLAAEIVTMFGGSIGKALDMAILFGVGTKMPVGIVTRLAQTSKPGNWDTHGPAWTDLHTSNVVTLNIDGSSGAAFFQSLTETLALAKPVYSNDGLFWVMNRKTHLHIKAKALAFDSSAVLAARTDEFPVVGGTIIELEDDRVPDNWICGGFGKNYLLAERAGIELGSSDAPLFIRNQTVYKGYARYDGKPVAGEAFVVVRFDNTAPTTSADFAPDWANTDLNELTISAAASASNAGKTVLTVSDYLADSSPVLYYKLGTQKVAAGDKIAVSGTGAWTSLTSGSTEIEAAAGKKITVVELNAAAASGGLVVSAGVVASVPKAAG